MALCCSYHSSPRAGTVVTIFLTLASIAVTGLLSWLYDLNFYSPLLQNYIYDKPYSRFQTYGIGILAAFYLRESVWRPSLCQSNLITCLSLLIMFASCVWLWFFLDCDGCWSVLQTTLYNCFCRIGWTIPLAIITHFCNLNVRGLITPINVILSFHIWDPFAKLTYAAYLVHPVVIRAFYYHTKVELYYDNWWISNQFFSFLCISYLLATVLFVCVENPMGTLITKLFQRKSSDSTGTLTRKERRWLASASADVTVVPAPNIQTPASDNDLPSSGSLLSDDSFMMEPVEYFKTNKSSSLTLNSVDRARLLSDDI
jgi:peptidoglycan/LPS O-acetylase OafA/YrhL